MWLGALVCGVVPLWMSQALPLVDLPQHLHLISVLHRLNDASTLYPEVFARRPELTPYLGYYYAVATLNWVMPLELANRVFLTAYVVGLPLSLAFLLRTFKRPTWPALLALPFAYGDSFAWGFINYCASLPLALLTCGLFVRAIEDSARRRYWAIWLAVMLTLVLLFHVQSFAWLGVALPFLLLTTPAPEGKTWKARVPALLGVVPGVVTFILWVGLRVGQPAEIAPGQPWRSWGPMLSKENLAFKSFDQNVGEFVTLRNGEFSFPILGGMAPDDQRVIKVVFLIALAALGVGLLRFFSKEKQRQEEGPVARWRIVGLAVLAAVLYVSLPFDIRGYMYYLNTRYAHLLAALLVCSVPVLAEVWQRRFLYVAAASSLVLMMPLGSAFRAFDEESKALTELARFAGDKPRVMGLIYDTRSHAVTHPVYLHASAVIARERGGLTNFSFALTPHSPVMYRGEPPPTFPSEWRPDQMRWEEQGKYYDHFVVRGPRPEQIFGQLMQDQLYVAGQAGNFFLVRRR